VRDAITRRQLLECAAVGAAALTLPPLLAACGGAEAGPASAGAGELPHSITVSNWPLYIDVDDETKRRPTLEAFTATTGIEVAYNEEINHVG
jgi:spermidine/putrescine transport system substrate-binding protein